MTTLRNGPVDLHCHTARSDGILEPLELYRAMGAAGVELAAITDHDTLAAFEELSAAGLGAEVSPDGPRLIAGVEINTLPNRSASDTTRQGPGLVARPGWSGEELHILGYGFDPADTALTIALAHQRDGRRVRLERTLELLAGMDMDVRDRVAAAGLDASSSLGRPHVARALVGAGHAASVEEAFEQLIGHGRPAYVERVGMGPRQAIGLIVAAGGLASLAHAPGAPDDPGLMAELMGWGLRGIEVHHPTFDEATSRRLAAFAREAGLVPTGGTDYHGDVMDYPSAAATVFVPARVGEELLAALAGPTAPPGPPDGEGPGQGSPGP